MNDFEILNPGAPGTFSGDVNIAGDLTVNGTTTTLNTATVTIDDPNLEINAVVSPTDVNASGGGITLKGDTDKTITWDNTNDNWTFNQAVNVEAALSYKVNNVAVLDATTLGSSVVNSSLTSVGTLTDLTVTNTIAGSINGNAATVSTITGLAPDTATTQATQAAITTCANLVTVGALNSGSITSGFGSIDVGASAIDGGVITADTNFAGNLTGNVTGNCTGTAATVTGAAQTAITSVGTLTSLAVTSASGVALNVNNSDTAVKGSTFTHNGNSGNNAWAVEINQSGTASTLRLNPNGVIGANQGGLQIETSAAQTAGSGLLYMITGSSSTIPAIKLLNQGSGDMFFGDGASGDCYIRTDGDLENTNNSYTGISDAKLKNSIADAGSQIADIEAIQFRKYKLNSLGENAPYHMGVIAQEIELICPELVKENQDYEMVDTDKVDDEGKVIQERVKLDTTTKAVKYSILYLKAVKALQEEIAARKALEARVKVLEDKINPLEATVNNLADIINSCSREAIKEQLNY